MPAEDDVGVLGGQLATAVGVAGLDHHRVALRAAGDVEATLDRELRADVVERRHGVGIDEHPGVGVGDDGIVAPGVPQLAGDLDELGGPPVAVVALEEPAAAEVLAGERVGRRHGVPRRPPVAQVVERGELAGQLEGLVERRVQRRRQTDAVGDRGEGGQHGQRVHMQQQQYVFWGGRGGGGP